MSQTKDKPRCPECTSERSKVVDRRGAWRRRECLDCSTRFSTEERVLRLRPSPMHRPKVPGLPF